MEKKGEADGEGERGREKGSRGIRMTSHLYGLWFIRSAYGTRANSSPPTLRERRAARLNC